MSKLSSGFLNYIYVHTLGVALVGYITESIMGYGSSWLFWGLFFVTIWRYTR